MLNSQLPEATITLDDFQLNCGSRQINLDYTVFNVNSTESLPANTPIAFYADNLLIAQTETQNSIPIGDFETGNITVTIPDFLDDNFLLTLAVDDDGVGNSTVIEINEENNTFNQNITLIPLPEITILPQILSCDEGFNSTIFNLEDHFINEVESERYVGLNHMKNIDVFRRHVKAAFDDLDKLIEKANRVEKLEEERSNQLATVSGMVYDKLEEYHKYIEIGKALEWLCADGDSDLFYDLQFNGMIDQMVKYYNKSKE